MPWHEWILVILTFQFLILLDFINPNSLIEIALDIVCAIKTICSWKYVKARHTARCQYWPMLGLAPLALSCL